MCLCGLSLQKNESLTIVCIDRLKNLCAHVVFNFFKLPMHLLLFRQVVVAFQVNTSCLQQETILLPRVRLRWAPQQEPMHSPNRSRPCL
jgi:hypothetical protein